MTDTTVLEPFPIFAVASRYLLFDINIISYARREHHICGVFVGNIPQAAQQNIFSGIPLELMPEEARLLVANGHAYVVDDVAAHRNILKELGPKEKDEFLKSMETQGMEAAKAAQKVSEQKKAKWRANSVKKNQDSRPDPPQHIDSKIESSTLLFHDEKVDTSESPKKGLNLEAMLVTPTLSYPPLKHPPRNELAPLPIVPSSYHLFAQLHSEGYFISPGLRFGCHYLVYPGDPLRFHSHFLATAADWTETLDLLDIVGGGRLSTGVKKSYLWGGVENQDYKPEEKPTVRTFSFEWAAISAALYPTLPSLSNYLLWHCSFWGWTADHALENVIAGFGHTQYTSTGRRFLIESQNATWLIGTIPEHQSLYGNNINNVEKVYIAMAQIETPYWQPHTPPIPKPPRSTALGSQDRLWRPKLRQLHEHK